jgi:hypothetical protein
MTLMRMLIAGAVGGFASIFTSWLITGTLFHRYQRLTPDTWRPEGSREYALSSLVLLAAGVAFGLLFYVTGGPARIGPQAWLGRGLLFGGTVWLAAACPVHATSAIFVRLHRGVVMGLLLDSLVGLLLVGVACAWAAR